MATKSVCDFYVVERMNTDPDALVEYLCIPATWIVQDCVTLFDAGNNSEMTVIRYPKPEHPPTKQQIESRGPFQADWPVLMVFIRYGTCDYSDAEYHKNILINKQKRAEHESSPEMYRTYSVSQDTDDYSVPEENSFAKLQPDFELSQNPELNWPTNLELLLKQTTNTETLKLPYELDQLIPCTNLEQPETPPNHDTFSAKSETFAKRVQSKPSSTQEREILSAKRGGLDISSKSEGYESFRRLNRPKPEKLKRKQLKLLTKSNRPKLSFTKQDYPKPSFKVKDNLLPHPKLNKTIEKEEIPIKHDIPKSKNACTCSCNCANRKEINLLSYPKIMAFLEHIFDIIRMFIKETINNEDDYNIQKYVDHEMSVTAPDSMEIDKMEDIIHKEINNRNPEIYEEHQRTLNNTKNKEIEVTNEESMREKEKLIEELQGIKYKVGHGNYENENEEPLSKKQEPQTRQLTTPSDSNYMAILKKENPEILKVIETMVQEKKGMEVAQNQMKNESEFTQYQEQNIESEHIDEAIWIEDDEEEERLEDEEHMCTKKKRYKTPIVLPPEYDANDSRWTLKYRDLNQEDDLIELFPGSRVCLKRTALYRCKVVSKDPKELARHLLEEIFTLNALGTCSISGQKKRGVCRPGLDKHALNILLHFVGMHSREENWDLSHRSIMNSIRNKLNEIRRKYLIHIGHKPTH